MPRDGILPRRLVRVHALLTLAVFLACLPLPAGARDEIHAGHENRWLVIAGSTRTIEDAWRIKTDIEADAVILNSTYFEGLEPGWFLVVTESHKTRKRALVSSRKLKARNIAADVKQAGGFFDFSSGSTRVVKLSGLPGESNPGECFVHTKMEAPDGSTSVSFSFQDPTSDRLVVRKGDESHPVKGLFFKTERVFWSPDSARIAFGDEDLYSGSGNQGFRIVDLASGQVSKVDTTSLGAQAKRGKRDFYSITNVCWMPSGDVVKFRLAVDFVGSSGNPGIDEERKDRLGTDFGRSDPLDLGTYAVYLDPSDIDLVTRPASVPLYDPDKFGYINLSGQMVIKPQFDRAGPFAEGRASVSLAGKAFTIDTEGRRRGRSGSIKSPASSKAPSPSGNLIPTRIGERFGYRDATGMIVIDPLFDRAEPFVDGLAVVGIGERVAYIDEKGETLGATMWDEVRPFSGGLARVRRGGKYGFIDRTGKVIIEPEFGQAGDFSEGLAPVKIGR